MFSWQYEYGVASGSEIKTREGGAHHNACMADAIITLASMLAPALSAGRTRALRLVMRYDRALRERPLRTK